MKLEQTLLDSLLAAVAGLLRNILPGITITHALALALLGTLPLVSIAQTKPAAEVERFFRQVDTVVGQRDGIAFERLLTDDFTFVAINGEVFDRKQSVDRQKAGLMLAGSANEILATRVYGDSAIVTYKTQTPLNGGTALLGTRVFVKQAGVWKWASSQGTLVGGTLPGK